LPTSLLHSFNTSSPVLGRTNVTIPAGRSILAYTVLDVTNRDRNCSVSFVGRERNVDSRESVIRV
jgi:hypothetical protein